MKWFYLFLFAVVVVTAQQEDTEDPDDYQYEDSREPKDYIDKNDEKVNEDINKFMKDLAVEDDSDNVDLEDPDEYQYEDSRELKDVGLDPAFSKNSPIENEQTKEKADQDDYALLWGDDSVAPLPVPDLEIAIDDEKSSEEKELQLDLTELENELKKYLDDAVETSDDAIIQETKKILEESDDSFSNVGEIKTNEEENNNKLKEDAVEDESTKHVDEIPVEITKPNDKIIEETKKILEDTDDAFGSKDEIKTEEENLDATREDLAEDEILQSQESIIAAKSKSDNSIVEKTLKMLEDTDDYFDDKQNDVEENENNEHDTLEEEDNVADIRADLHADLEKLFDTLDKLSDDDSADEKHLKEKSEELLFKDGSEELVENSESDYEEVDFDKILEHIANEADADDDSHAEVQALVNDEKNEPNPDDAFEEDAESLSNPVETIAEPILFLDAIVDKPNTDESIEETNDADILIESNEPIVVEKEILTENENQNSDEPEGTIDINELNSEELSGLVVQFTDANSEILDVQDTFNDDTAEHIQLTVDDAVVVTSPNYPDAYPTNSIKDWILTGDGVGIELNVTDFLVNGALGHYLLVKPGGVDDSGHDGIVFTYRLNSEKRFRFMDVDRVFVRFESKQGFFGMRGFRLTARMIAALPEDPEPLPPAEPVMQPPHSLHTLHLAVVAPQFQAMRENFRLLLADMAEQYIKENNVDPGLNTTSEVTQISSVSACPVTWPNYELCTAVTYGVSLTYEEGEPMLDEVSLKEMWEVYSVRDPFALRLRQMGVAEFLPPRSIMFAWMLIGSGVLLGVVLLVMVLYRFNCLEGYTRMRDFNDSDSLHNEKRDLDLYPTPHQTLPPLYAEHEYKWPAAEDTTRVDMGGLAKHSYARDMYDFESDEEVSQNRGGAVTARDSYAQRNSNA